MALRDKIATLDSTADHLLDWEAIRLATKRRPRSRHTWAARMAPQQLPKKPL